VLAAAVLVGPDAAAQTCDADHTITWPASNPLWQICWVSPPDSSGIDGSTVEITSASYNGKPVFSRGHVPVINVKYDPGGCGGSNLSYRDWGNELAPFDADNVIRPGYAEPTRPPKTVCDNPGSDVGTFKGVAVQKLPDRLIVMTQVQAGWYRYVPTWTFFLDGTFQPAFQFTAVTNTCTPLPHYHNAYWRLDMDVDGFGNDVVEEFNSGTWNSLTTETERLHSPATERRWRVRDKLTGSGYELVPDPQADVANAFAAADLWALAYRSTEFDDGGATLGDDGDKVHTGKYVNGENIDGKDVVLWYRAGVRHDGPAECEVRGPTLHPFAAAPGLPTVSIGDVSANEGNSGTVSAAFAVSLSAPSSNTVTVNYATADGTATAGSDYTAASGSVTFPPGTTSQTINVVISGDTTIEATETFVVNLSGASNAVIGDSQGEGTIVNDDASTTGLVAAYGFNEGSGTTAADGSGAGHSGTISGAVWTTGKFGGALQFDGINDLVTIADAPDLDLSTGMTVEAWVNPDALSGWRTVVLKEAPGGLAYALYANDNLPRWAGYINTGGPDLSAKSSSPLPLNVWSHVAVTYDGTTIRLYQNGTQVGTQAATGGIIATSGALRIGGNTVWPEWFAGGIDEVRVYKRALTAAEISSDMSTPIGGGPAPDTTPPAVTITAPANNSFVGGTITVSATASDNVGVASVQFLLDGQPLGAADTSQPYSVTWDTTLTTDGNHVLTARAVDGSGNEATSAAVTVVVDNTNPSVAITSPPDGATVSGTITVTATASDSSGISNVQFRLDGANLGAPDTTAPYSVSWTTTQVSNGAHTLTAIATDSAGRPATSAAVNVTVSNGSSGWTVPSGLVAAYTFSEGTGTTTADASGGGNTGMLSGPSWTTSGRFGSALQFDGVNDLVTIADAASLDLSTGMTVEAWVNPDVLSGWRTVVLKEAPSGLAYALYANDNLPRWAGYINTGGPDLSAKSSSALPLNVWSHVAVTYEGTTIRLYQNGTQVGTQAATGRIIATSGVLRIGGNTVWPEWFAGRIDEVRIYNRALTPAEIAAGVDHSVGGP
jgi:hypothetical protein